MHVELISFYIQKENRDLYSSFTYFDENNMCLGIYLGEDDVHVWVQPIRQTVGTRESKIIASSVSRIEKSAVVITEPSIGRLETCPYGDMLFPVGYY